jgi:hypothetical protein
MDLNDFGKSAAELKVAFETLQEQIKNNAKLLARLTGDAAKGFEPSISKTKKLTEELAKANKQSLSNYKERIQFESKLQQAQKELIGLTRQREILVQRLSVASRDEKIQLLSLIDNYDDLILNSQELVDNTKKLKEELEPINKAVGTKLFGAFSDIAGKIPGLSRFSGPFKEASEAAEKMATQNQLMFGNTKGISKAQLESLKTGRGLSAEFAKQLGLVDRNGNALRGIAAANKAQSLGITAAAGKSMSPLMAGIKSLGPALSKAFGPLTLIIELVQAFLLSDKAAGDLAKSMDVTYERALDIRGELTEMGNLSGDIALNTRALQESYMAIGESIGAQVDMGAANLELMTKLRENAGVSNETFISMSKYAAATGQEVESATTGFLGGAKAISIQAGKALNIKQLMNDISKTSNAVKLSIKGGAQGLGEAAAKAKLLGMNLDQADKLADSLLNFEESISAELEAELLTGKDLNLERARLAALNNDYATLTSEIARNVGSAAEFSAMNRLQQEAIAKAVGMTREELASTLTEQEALRTIGRDLTEEEKAAYEFAKEKYGADKAAKMLGEGHLKDMMQQKSIQDRFNQSVEKLREIFVSIAEPLLKILDPLVEIVTDILPAINILLQPIMVIFKGIGKIISTYIKQPIEAIKELLSGVMDIFTGDFESGFKKIGHAAIKALMTPFQALSNGVVEIFNGFISIINKIPGVNIDKFASPDLTKMITGVKDGMIGPDGGLIVSRPKGTYSLDANDSVIAGTNLNKPTQSTSPNVSVDLSPLLTEMKALREEQAKSNAQPIMVQNMVDGTNYGTALAQNTYKIQ